MQQQLTSNLRSNFQRTRCAFHIAPVRILSLALVLFSTHATKNIAQDSQTSLNEVISKVNLDTPLDPEELEMAKTMLVQDLEEKALKQDATWRLPEDGTTDSAKRGEPFKTREGTADDESEKGEVTVDAAPVEVAVEDGLPTAALQSPKNVSSVAAKTGAADTAAPQGSMDGTMGIVRTRLASEEKFNSRLQKLLEESAVDSRKKQQKIDLLQAQLRKATQQQQDLRGDSLVKSSQQETEIAQTSARADATEKQLRRATHELGIGRKTVAWLRGRVNTLLLNLGSATHIGKGLQKELVEENSDAASMKHKLASIQQEDETKHRGELVKVQASKASEDVQLQALEHQNELLQQRVHSMDKRDKILQRENKLLRGQLRRKTIQAEGSVEELEKAKGALADAQKVNIQVQSKYADSLKALLISQAGGEHGGASPVGAEAGQLSPPPPVMETSDDEASEAPSSLLELGRDSRSLTALSTESDQPTVTTHVLQSPVKTSNHRENQLELSRDSQGLSALLEGSSDSTHLA